MHDPTEGKIGPWVHHTLAGRVFWDSYRYFGGKQMATVGCRGDTVPSNEKWCGYLPMQPPHPSARHFAPTELAAQRWCDEQLRERGYSLIDLDEDSSAYQREVGEWALECFGEKVVRDKVERCYRFGEEALELMQAGGMSRADVLLLVDYVFGRPVGEVGQEVGGVMTTLATLCNAHDINLMRAATVELARVWTKIDKIREKQAHKPHGTPLPGPDVGVSAPKNSGHDLSAPTTMPWTPDRRRRGGWWRALGGYTLTAYPSDGEWDWMVVTAIGEYGGRCRNLEEAKGMADSWQENMARKRA